MKLIQLLKNICSTHKTIKIAKIAAQLPGHIYIKDKQGNLLWSNNEQTASFGCSDLNKVVGKDDFALAWAEPAIIQECRDNDLHIMASGTSAIFEERASFCGQDKIFISKKCPLRNKDNQIIGLMGVSLDITGNKLVEAELRKAREIAELDIRNKTEFIEQLLLEVPAHIYWKNAAGIYLGCNDNQARTVGYEFGKDVVGKSDFDLRWGVVCAQNCRDNDIRIMQSGEKEIIEETAVINGVTRTFLGLKAPMKNRDNQAIGVLGISVDITDRKNVEEELRKAKIIAETANNSKIEFLENMRHDFRTPFTGILGLTNILYQNETDPDKKANLQIIINAAQALLNQLNEITDFIAVEDKKYVILEKQFAISEVVLDLEHILLPAIKEKKLQFNINIDATIPKYVIGDQRRTERILMNLLANALKFTNQGTIALGVEIAKTKNKQIIIKYSITDTGIGISENDQSIIFEKFARISPSYKGVYTGKGLGLRIVKQFVEDLEGEIYVKSEPNKGSTFIVLIPYKASLLDSERYT